MPETATSGPFGPPYKTILSLDGGGIRGYSSLMILEKLMGTVQKKLGLSAPPLPCEYFDIIGGTSTGGIIAILLGRLRMSASDALDAYNRVAEQAFIPKVYIPFRPPTRPRYSDMKLVEAIQSELELTEAANGNRDALFADREAPKTVVLAITKVNVNAGPTLFKSYDVEPAWKDCKIWEVVRATSAATTFFDPIETGRDRIAFVDAGFGYNNPCEILCQEADKAIPGKQTSCIVSIGTGLKGAVGVNSKPFTLLRALVRMATTSRAVDARLQETFGTEQPQRYWRFDENVAIGEIKMDDWRKLQAIAGHTHNYLNAFATTTAINHCADALIAAKPHLLLRRTGVGADMAGPLQPKLVALTEQEEAARMGIDQLPKGPQGKIMANGGLDFLRSLSFADMEAREQNVAVAYHATHEWMLNSTQYSEWKEFPGQRLLIKGKAGCGKSTLVKHLFQNEISAARSGPTERVVCGFFFNGRGGPMEKTLKGMLRTILHQMVLQSPTAYRGLSQFHHDMKQECASRDKSAVDWTGESLTKMFEIVMQSPTLPVLIFIDALDEGDGFSPAEVFALLETLTGPNSDGSRSAVSVCLSSRPDNFVNHRKKWTTVDLADFNGEDIETYTTNRLYTIAKDCADFRYQQLATELVPQILRRADGVFLWVRLVVDEISVAMECGESPRYIRAQLYATPTDLWDRFGKMLLKVGNHHLSDMQRLLQILLAAERPLTVEELAHVLPLSAPDPPRTLQEVWNLRSAEQICHDMRKRIQLCCGGLVEVVETNRYLKLYHGRLAHTLTSQVQFIHQSVKDYLNGSQIQKDLGDILGPPGREGNGHQLLLNACIRYLQLPEVETARAASVNLQRPTAGDGEAEWDAFWGQLQSLWAKTTSQYPLSLYSPHWIRHAERSIAAGNHESDESWRTMESIFQAWRFFPYHRQVQNSGNTWCDCLYTYIYDNMRVTSDEAYSCLLSFAAYQGFVGVFEDAFSAARQDMSSSSLNHALTAACDCGLTGEFEAIGGVGNRFRRYRESEKRGFGLPETAWEAKETIVRILLKGGADVNQTEKVGHFGSALTAACWGGRVSMVQMLLDSGADVNAEVRGVKYGTPLIASVWGSSTAVAKLLIQRGADINAQVRAGYVGSALAEAAIEGDPDMGRTLIDGGADVNLVLWYGGFGSALAAAAKQGKMAMTKLLVERGASVNMQLPGKFGSALAAAALTPAHGEEMMELLITAGANIDLPLLSGNYGSALAAAASSEKKAAVELLLRHGADVNLALRRGKFKTTLIAAVRASDQYRSNC